MTLNFSLIYVYLFIFAYLSFINTYILGTSDKVQIKFKKKRISISKHKFCKRLFLKQKEKVNEVPRNQKYNEKVTGVRNVYNFG